VTANRPILAEFQTEAERWLLGHPFGILGDEMRVGKSFPALSAAQRIFLEGPNLIVCPGYLIPNWVDYLQMYGEIDIAAIEGSKQQKEALLETPHTWTVCSYALTTRPGYMQALFSRQWGSIIYDEAHHLRGHKTQSYKTAKTLRTLAGTLWMLSGTPVVKGPDDLWSLLNLCDPKKFSSYWKFVEEHCLQEWTPFGVNVVGYKDQKAFEEMLKPYMLRRLYDQVMPGQPPVEEVVLKAKMSPSWAKIHKDAKKEFILHHPDLGDVDLNTGGAMVIALRRTTAESGAKTDVLLDLLEDVGKDPVVVFCWYRDTAEQAGAILAEKGYKNTVITGKIPAPGRKAEIKRLWSGDVQVLIATMGSLREGEDMSCSHVVVFLEEHWVSADNEQAAARLKGRNQKHPITKYIILADKSVDVAVHKITARRQSQSLKSVIGELYDDPLS
jgi:SNF2 family DNA or RNA helicase